MRVTSKRQRFWFGVVLLVVGMVVFISSIHLVDVPGPMAPDKPEFTFEFSKTSVVLAALFGLTGGLLLASKFKHKT
jgi:hypothetical protein